MTRLPSPRAATERFATLPAIGGVGFKPQHFDDILADPRGVGFFEIHAENYFGAGGPPHRRIAALRERFPLSIHGVGMSIGGAAPLDRDHLARFATLVGRYEPESVSEHLAWSTHSGFGFPDLLPLPLTEETLDRVVEHIDEVQTAIRRPMLLENPSTYFRFAASTIPEAEFIAEVARRSGCGLLLDVANVDVSATNHGFDPMSYLDAFPLDRVAEIHLAGRFETEDEAGHPLFVDAHGSPVADPVWRLYEAVVDRIGPVATLIERDDDIPSWDVLAAEANRATTIMNPTRAAAEAHADAA
ncbi:MNIO family bufferin maturase [Pinisolibacter sp.]|uniref:MNIO family bufferin maturase n=1 Tax=Pinisolibacter sp. TaxID=2172024 RepID=UPI002FDE199F